MKERTIDTIIFEGSNTNSYNKDGFMELPELNCEIELRNIEYMEKLIIALIAIFVMVLGGFLVF